MLTLHAANRPAGCIHLSAASGLVQVGKYLYVVADDELALGRFEPANAAPGVLVPLFDNALPVAADSRKAAKPDLEALALLPASPAWQHASLIAFGSGSRASRQRGARVALNRHGAVVGPPHIIDLAPLFAPIRHVFADLNIEGAFVSGDDLCLLQRGNTGDGRNACIRFDLEAFTAWLQGRAAPPAVGSIAQFDLGELDGVPLGFTDGTALSDGGWLFSATAEATADAYLDGPFTGSVIGRVDAGGQVAQIERLTGSYKVEGIALAQDGAEHELRMVTDADDRRAPALLLAALLGPGLR